MTRLAVAVLGAFAVTVAASGSLADDDEATAPERANAAGTQHERPAPEPAAISLPIAGDRTVEVVLGPEDSSQVIVYMHGVCGDPLAFRSWARAASEVATLVSLRGDDACPKRPGRFKWSWDAPHIDRRIKRAVGAVDTLRRQRAPRAVPSSEDDVILVGYSQGAYRAELLASRYPTRFRRVALIAHPRQPQPSWLGKAERVLLVAGERDIRQPLRDARDELVRLGKDVLYRELPEARHGEYGPRAAEVMGPSLRWLVEGKPGADGGEAGEANNMP